ncbi:disease resistance protein RUN1-like [Vigna umbellata]|uniref:disease resistance protein RUN1-like n=1 Tax=Vigna umbellata TaxID=87088 RepID=UPI001F5EA6A1|nr:disease resistance protein RUN1-like [Vigna umbellata]
MEFASSASKLSRYYDVLINFNGEDIRRKFVSHLDSALSSFGLTTFLHHQNAVESTHVQQPILDLCRVVIVVFTKTYSESAWCLYQLQQIIQWHQTYCRHVLPVYYEIQPSDVRFQKGDFGKAFKETAHQTFSAQQLKHGMSRWSHALTKAANLFGWDESNHRSDAELVHEIVKSVRNSSVFSATKFPVGLQYPVEELIQTIKDKSMDVCTIGICGMRGSGKTTLAKAIYHQIHGTFMHKSFIEGIAQFSEPRGGIHFQEQLLSDVIKTKVKIDTLEMGKDMIRDRLLGKRILIVLDDMDDYLLLLSLRESLSWLSKGTVIIMTTTDDDLFNEYQVQSVFRINPMNEHRSLELLSWHAFREAKPKEEYDYLARRLISLCGGLPLVLEVIGSTLFERTEVEWYSVLFKLEKIPSYNVQQKLKISLDRLSNQLERNLFVDLCCFFVGKDRAYATKILSSSVVEADSETGVLHRFRVDADRGIRVLMEGNLIKVKRNNKLGMHPLLQELGKTIFHETSRRKLWNNGQLLFYVDAEYALKVNDGRKDYEVLLSTRREPSRLPKDGVNSENLSPKLRWISFRGFSTEYLPNDFNAHDIIAIDLKHSLLQFFLEKPQVLKSLKVLNLSHSMYLTETPNFWRLPNLEELILKDCPRLQEVHQSIGHLCYLILLNLKDCKSLSNLPQEIYRLKSLRTLILSGCSKIDPMEKDIVQMKSLITLAAENTTVKKVPFSIVSSKAIGYISLRGFERLSCNPFPSIIIRSWMSPTINSISYINLNCVDMEDNSWDDIAPLLGNLANLRTVLVQCNTEFQLSKQVKNILVDYFSNITESEISKQHFRSSLIGVGAYHEFFNAVSNNISEVLASSESSDVSLPGDNPPYWLAYMGQGDSVSFTVPPDNDMKGMVMFLCVFNVSTPEIVASEGIRSVLIVNYTKCTLQIHMHGKRISFNDIDWQAIRSNLGSGDKVEIFVTFSQGVVVKNTHVYLIFGESHYLEKVPTPKKK